jgi:RNA polymerase sigma-70 factor (ECF subfamily)
MHAADPHSTTAQILSEEPHLHRVAQRLARSPNDADDLVQDTLLRAFRARARFQPGTSIRAWTTTILRHTFITGALRSRRRRLQNDTDAGSLLGHAPARRAIPARGPLQYEALVETLEDPVKRALDQVPWLYRAPLLTAIDELSSAEIAGALKVPKGTVMSRIHRARERLRAELHTVDARRYRRRGPAGGAASGAS